MEAASVLAVLDWTRGPMVQTPEATAVFRIQVRFWPFAYLTAFGTYPILYQILLSVQLTNSAFLN